MIIKNPRVLLHRSQVGPDDTIESFDSHQKFVAVLQSGTAITVKVEMSMDGTNGWQEVCTFDLDTVGQELDTGLLVIPMRFIRATVIAQSGPTPSAIVYMGN
ncbi:hypothetical protein [Duganella sp. FT27W]|uniref:hypothetical protein n=1 Tax=Duganella sp. FT27W TaxID=2654636 RepID=UPI00128B7C65|nr:hypothetical protein [Duganella sp. FT27W]MPQ56320.1 hypothetical protein [Duganella sp. FT27W]